jgi:hypothetical protein
MANPESDAEEMDAEAKDFISILRNEVRKYLREPSAPLETCPRRWWKDNQARFPMPGLLPNSEHCSACSRSAFRVLPIWVFVPGGQLGIQAPCTRYWVPRVRCLDQVLGALYHVPGIRPLRYLLRGSLGQVRGNTYQAPEHLPGKSACLAQASGP